jgi:Na+-translocating ferredoxin:NAD+ oxidoreductase subunit G
MSERSGISASGSGNAPERAGAGEAEGSRGAGSPLRALLTLGGGGALAGLLIVIVYQATLPAIEANRAAALAAAVDEVLGAPHAFETLYLVDGELRHDLPEGADPAAFERVHPGFRADGSLIGYAMQAARPGFQDFIHVIFGYDPRAGTILGMRVLRHLETPGLGDKIVNDEAWVAQFDGARPPLASTKPGEATGPHEVDMITGATISAETVMQAVNQGVERWREILDAHAATASPRERPTEGIVEGAGDAEERRVPGGGS